MNRVVLMGRLTKKPELRKTASGISVCRFTVAVDRRFKSQGDEPQADFIPCVAWRNQADFVAAYFDKGHRICLDGSIQTSSYTDKNGKTQYSTDVIVDHAEFAQSRSEGETTGGSPYSGTGTYAQARVAGTGTGAGTYGNASTGVRPEEGYPEINDDDLPF